MNNDLLKLRKEMKDKKPDFIRQAAHRKKKLGDRWVRPKGLQSKLRLHRKGHHKLVEIGYSSPAAVRGFTRKGFLPVPVSSIKDMNAIDKKTQCAVISATVGMKKKLQLLEVAKKANVTVSSIKDIDSYISNAKQKFEQRTSTSKQKGQTRQQKKEELDKKKDKKEDKKKDVKEAADKNADETAQDQAKTVDSKTEETKDEKSDDSKKSKKSTKTENVNKV